MTNPSESRNFITAAGGLHKAHAYALADRYIAARDPVTGLLPLHVRTERGELRATDHQASALDMGRATSGLVMLSQIAHADRDAGADKYLREAEHNYHAGKELLSEQDYFLHLRDFDDHGNVTVTKVGEDGKSAPGEDNMSRVNARAYALRAAGDLYRATLRESYRATLRESYREDFERYFWAWVRDFYDPIEGGFFVHANVTNSSDHKELGLLKDPGGADSLYPGQRGVKGNDGTVYALSAVLLLANEILDTEETRRLVREQLDTILGRFHRMNGMLWENYSRDWKPVSVDWQNQPLMSARPGEDARTSHVAIGGHTAMAPQQIIEGARQLFAQGSISDSEYGSYVDQSVSLFQQFVTDSSAIDWNTGAVHNGILVEERIRENRWLRSWEDAGWQQAELIQTLLRFKEEGPLREITGPNGQNGEDLLVLAERHYLATYPVPTDYSFDGFGNPDVYHRPQLAFYHQGI